MLRYLCTGLAAIYLSNSAYGQIVYAGAECSGGLFNPVSGNESISVVRDCTFDYPDYPFDASGVGQGQVRAESSSLDSSIHIQVTDRTIDEAWVVITGSLPIAIALTRVIDGIAVRECTGNGTLQITFELTTTTLASTNVTWNGGIGVKGANPESDQTNGTQVREVAFNCGGINTLEWDVIFEMRVFRPTLNTGRLGGSATASARVRSIAVLDANRQPMANATVASSHGFIYPTADEPDEPERIPVIVIPGIMGTSLKRSGDLIWYDPLKAGNPLDPSDSFLNVLALDDNGNSDANIQPGNILDGSDGPLGSLDKLNFYGPLVGALRLQGYSEGESLFTFSYDWRFSNETNSARLNDFIEQVVAVSGQPRVDIVSHSMGGLLTRRYASQDGGRLRKVIYLGTPHLGAPKAFGPLAYNSSLAQLMSVPLINNQTFAQLSRTFPSAFQLLPRSPFIFARTLARKLSLAESYLQPTDEGLGFLKSSAWVTAADAFHEAIETPLNVSQFQIVGSGTPTLTGLTLLNSPSESPKTLCGVSGDGDGTVPTASASGAPGAAPTSTFFVPVSHDNLARDGIVEQLVINILQDLPTTSIPGVTMQPPTATHGVVEWCTASPIKVTVTDNSGRVNQVGTDGSTLVGIPRSDFFVFEHNESGFLVSDQPHLFSIAATAAGLFSLMIQEKNATGDVVGTTTFTDIPVLHSSRASFVLTPGNSAPILALDVNGDGTTDFSASPNQPPSAVASIRVLGQIIAALPLQTGISRSLLTKIEQAAHAIEDGRNTRKRVAMLLLKAFIVEVKILISLRRLPADVGELLVEQAQRVIAALNIQ